jgi:hypothetical protein
VGTIDSTGLYTAPSDVDGYHISITATATASPGGFGTAAVTLPTVTLSITPNAVAVLPGASHGFTATVVGLADSQVNWTVQGTSGGAITSASLYTTPSTGVYRVIATSSANANYSAAAEVLFIAAV